MNGKRAKLIRKVSRLTGASDKPLKDAWKQQNHNQRGKTRRKYLHVLLVASQKGIV